MEKVEIDIRGQVCPSTLLTVLNEVNRRYMELTSGQCCLVVSSDNRAATGTVPSAVKNMGLVAEVEKAGAYYVMTIGKGGMGAGYE